MFHKTNSKYPQLNYLQIMYVLFLSSYMINLIIYFIIDYINQSIYIFKNK